MGKLSDRRRKLRKRKSRKQEREEELRQIGAELWAQVNKEREHLAKVRDKKHAAEFDERKEFLADKIDGIRSEISRLKDKRERVEARQLKADAIVKQVGKRIRRLTQQIRRKKHYASKHFRYEEGYCNDGTPMPKEAREHFSWWCENVLERVRSNFGGASVNINSGYRHTAYNARIGGASDSQHIYDKHPRSTATDITVAGVAPSRVQQYMDTLSQVDGLGRYSTFTHGDPRGRAGYPSAQWYG